MLRSCIARKQPCSIYGFGPRCFVRGRHTTIASTPSESPITAAQQAAKPALLTLDYGTLNHYTQTSVPTSEQITAANRFFTTHKPSYLFTAAHFRDFPQESNVPEVTFLGRSNVGKSSLLNTLFNRNKTQTALAHVSKRPGKTKTMNVFGLGQEGTAEGRAGGGVTKTVKPGMSAELHEKRGAERQVRRDEIIRQNWMGRGGIAVVDCPGYGFHSREEWGQEVLKYLQNRKQLRRAFVLIDCEHGLKSTDRDILGLLREASVPHQIILSKADKVLNLGPREPSPVSLSRNLLKLREICEGIRNEVQPNNARGPVALGDILCCSSERNWGTTRLGIDGIRFAILQAAGLGEGSGRGRQPLDLSMDDSTPDSNLIAWNTM